MTEPAAHRLRALPARIRNQAGPYRRKPARHRPRTRFVIYGQGRTGSSLLRALLNHHPDVRCEGEILGEPVLSPRRHVDRHARLSPLPVFGFKVKVYQLTETQGVDARRFLTRLASDGYRIIHLYRENLLRHAISNMFAIHRGTYHDRAQGERPSIEVDPAVVVTTMEKRHQHRINEQASLAGLEHLRACYEDELLSPARHEQTTDRIFRYLDLQPIPAASPFLARSVTGSLRARISNYDELVNAVAATPFAHFLEDARYESTQGDG